MVTLPIFPFSEEFSSNMAPQDVGLSGPMSHTLLQDRIHQTYWSLINFAITNRPSLTGLHPIHPFAGAKFDEAALNPTDNHWVLSGSLLHSLLPPALAVIAEGNKVFPSKKEHLAQLRSGLRSWTKRNGHPPCHFQHLRTWPSPLVRHTQHITNHITSPL